MHRISVFCIGASCFSFHVYASILLPFPVCILKVGTRATIFARRLALFCGFDRGYRSFCDATCSPLPQAARLACRSGVFRPHARVRALRACCRRRVINERRARATWALAFACSPPHRRRRWWRAPRSTVDVEKHPSAYLKSTRKKDGQKLLVQSAYKKTLATIFTATANCAKSPSRFFARICKVA